MLQYTRALALAVLAAVAAFMWNYTTTNKVARTCRTIGDRISSASDVFYELHANFESSTYHWFPTAGGKPTCVLDAGSQDDVAIAMQEISASRTPFAVQSGGHSSNPGHSSTSGVHISVARMKQVELSDDKSTVEIGTGQQWGNVYTLLQGTGYNVVGGRVLGPGLGGYTLGGGFSWKTNQFGLTCDTTTAYKIVLPNGTATRVTLESDPDLFFALKGGMNRFGVITSIEFRTHPQPPLIFGGWAMYGPADTPGLLEATAAFDETNKDPRTAILTNVFGGPSGSTTIVIYFHDGPGRPESFAPFEAFQPVHADIKTASFSDVFHSVPPGTNKRGAFHTLSTSALTPAFVEAVRQEADAMGKLMTMHNGTIANYVVEPFVHDYGQYATDSAYPHADSPLPLDVYFDWASADEDEFWYGQMRASVGRLEAVAERERITGPSYTKYPNYALFGTTAEELYGADNAARLRLVRARVDPDRVMDLAGGFAI